MPAPEAIIRLLETFQRNRAAYSAGSYNETQVRREFIDPFFEALGWDVSNRQGHAEAYKDVKHEDSLKIGAATKAPDYSFRIGGARKFFVEAKKPSVNLKDDISPAFQVRRYAWSAKLPLSILTDFEELAIYDCRHRPDKKDTAATGRVRYYRCEEYPEKWDELAALLSREAVLRGDFDAFVEGFGGARGTQEVDAVFLAEIERWRAELARNFALRNASLSQRELNFAVQRTIDRIIFLRIAEDRGIEPYEQLAGIKDYPALVQLFRRADDKYNSGLFHFKSEAGRDAPDDLTPTLALDDKVLAGIVKNLYYPDSPYEFSVLPADILGQVYEQFLGKVIRLTAGHQAKVEEKPEVKKAGGVYYTPTYIVEYIVRQTVGRLVAGKTPNAVSNLRILDPACGSGSFLLGAYQYLLDWHRDYYAASDKKSDRARLVEIGPDDYRLTIEERKRILLNNIYGVDIDAQAVEVTKLSLLLKVLEGENQQQLGLFQERALPSLDGNIQCGNSLIGPDFYSGQQTMFDLDEDERYRINVFDWQAAFPGVMAAGGFDAVIGNPPYIFTRSEGFTKFEKDYFYQKFKYQNYQLNTFAMFTEAAYFLIRPSGRFGFIIPNNWLTLGTMKPFRDFLVQETGELTVVNNLHKVFSGANVDTSIVTFAKQPSGLVDLIESTKPDEYTLIASVESKSLLNEQVIQIRMYKDEGSQKLVSRIEGVSQPLASIAEVKAGLKAYETGKGQPPQSDKMKKDRIYHSLERVDDSYRKYLEGKDVKRYELAWSGSYLKYGPNLAAPRDPRLFEGRRILIRQIPSLPPYSINGVIVGGEELNDINSMIILASPGYSLEYILGVINSRLLTYWFDLKFDKFQRKTFPQFKVNELAQFPIRSVDQENPAEVAQHDRMVTLVEAMLALHKGLAAARTPDEKTRLERQIEATDKQIDALVYQLYGLTEEEIKIVEG